MGFFSDLKEDLNQAVNELMPDENADAAKEEKEGKDTSTIEETPVLGDGQDDEETLKQLVELEQILQGIELPDQNASAAQLDSLDVVASEEPVELEAEKVELTTDAEEEKAEQAQEEIPAVQAPAMAISLSEEEAGQAEEDAEMQETIGAFQDAVNALKDSVEEQIAKSEESADADAAQQENLEEELRATFGAQEGEETVEDYMHAEAIRTGEDIIDKSWVLDLKGMETMDETAIITAGMRVKGDILSNGSADISGEVIGNVQVKGKLNITGRINGNSKAQEIFADSARVQGDMISDNTVKIGVDSVVIGNVEATSAVIAGAVKGTIDVKGPVILDATAVVLGNVRAKSMQINNGARIEGMCVLCYAEQSAAKFFEEQANL